MNLSARKESLCVDVAYDLFGGILEELEKGSLCPCSLAITLAISEKDIYPFLAELLAREWITVLLDDEFGIGRRGIASERYAPSESMKTNLAIARERHQRIIDYYSGSDLLIQRTKIWYDFFRTQKEETCTKCSSYYLKITCIGIKSLKRLRN